MRGPAGSLTRRRTPGTARDVKIVAGRAYVADGDGGLVVVDVTDPGSPALLGVYATPSISLNGVAVAGTLVYGADTFAGLLVIDAGEPAHPRLLGRTRTSDSASGVAVAGRYAYVADGTSGLQVIDVSDPARPRVVGSQGLFGNSGYFVSVALTGNRAVVADLINGVHVRPPMKWPLGPI